jgi:hypothetical protein
VTLFETWHERPVHIGKETKLDGSLWTTTMTTVNIQTKLVRTMTLTPKAPRIHGFKIANSIDQIVKNIIQIGPNFISLELAKIIAYVGQLTNKFEEEEVQIGPTQNP